MQKATIYNNTSNSLLMYHSICPNLLCIFTSVPLSSDTRQLTHYNENKDGQEQFTVRLNNVQVLKWTIHLTIFCHYYYLQDNVQFILAPDLLLCRH